MDERLLEKLTSWGGHLEIAAICELYKVGIVVWELSQSGKLKTTVDSSLIAGFENLQHVHLARHRGVHYNAVTLRNRQLPLTLT